MYIKEITNSKKSMRWFFNSKTEGKNKSINPKKGREWKKNKDNLIK